MEVTLGALLIAFLLFLYLETKRRSARLQNLIAEEKAGIAEASRMTASIGVALTGPDCACFDALYRNADAALYETKRRGRNAFTLYTPGQ